MKQVVSERTRSRVEKLSAGTIAAIFVPVLVIAQTTWLAILAWGAFNLVGWAM